MPKRTATEQLLENLNRLLQVHGISQAELARRARMTQRTVNHTFRSVEEGHSPTLTTIEKLARSFDLSVAELLSPDLKVDQSFHRGEMRILSRQLARLVDSFLAASPQGRLELLRVAEEEAIRGQRED
jgi:transcriptional regulator with XRE-family HTH domain